MSDDDRQSPNSANRTRDRSEQENESRRNGEENVDPETREEPQNLETTVSLYTNPDLGTTSKRKRSIPSLIVSRLPKHLNLLQIKDHVEELCGPCDITLEKEEIHTKTVRAKFSTEQQLKEAKRILNTHCLGDHSVVATIEDPDKALEEGMSGHKRQRTQEKTPWGLDSDVWRPDPKGLYGVKPQFLSSLSINCPLGQWVLVLNFRCGRDELKEIMELAGDVLVLNLQFRRSGRFASVMYSHPLEALQAVSMLNGQTLYGRQMIVKILNTNNTVPLLPKGLNGLGPGLAMYGKPLRDVVKQYERFIEGKQNSLDVRLFRTPIEQSTNEEEEYIEGDSSRKRAADAIKALIAEGLDLKDLLLGLKDIVETLRDHEMGRMIDELIMSTEMANKVDQHYSVSHVDASPSAAANRQADGTVTQPNVRVSDGPLSYPSDSQKDSQQVEVGTDASPVSLSLSPTDSLRGTPSPTYYSGGPRHKAPAPPPAHWRAPTTSTVGVLGPPGYTSSGRFMPSPTNQLYRPSAPRPQQGFGEPMMAGMRFGPSDSMSGPNRPMLGQMQMSGQMTRSISSPMPAPMCVMPGPMAGPMPGPFQERPASSPAGLMGGSSAGPNFSSPGPNLSAPGPNFTSPGPNFSAPGPNFSAARHNFSAPGPNFSAPGRNFPPCQPATPPFTTDAHPSPSLSTKLQVSNLPPNMSFARVSEMLSRFGQVMLVLFTEPTCVVVQYAFRAQAEACLHNLDKSLLDNNTIYVRFVA